MSIQAVEVFYGRLDGITQDGDCRESAACYAPDGGAASQRRREYIDNAAEALENSAFRKAWFDAAHSDAETRGI